MKNDARYPVQDGTGRRTATTTAALAAVLALAAPLATSALTAPPAAGSATPAPGLAAARGSATPAPGLAAAPGGVATVAPAGSWKGDGEVAVISDGRLELLGHDGADHVVAGTGPGAPSQPSWSPDGKWVAFLRTPVAPGYDAPASALWTARADGGDAHRLSAPGADVSQYAWGPAAAGGGEELAFSVVPPPSSTSSAIYLATASGPPRRLATYPGLIDFSWAPSGSSLAISYRQGPAGQPAAGKGFVEITPLNGKAGRTVYTLADNGYAELDGWWPDGKGLLFWDDLYGSASIAADGLALDSLELPTLKVRSLATTLVHPDWVAWSPNGATVAVVAGGDREIWDAGKRVELCSIPAATCGAVPLGPGNVMSLDPAWTATGLLVYTRAPAARLGPAGSAPTAGGAGPGGWGPTGAWTTANVAAWYGAQRLFGAGPAGAEGQALAATGVGAHNPLPTSGGLLYVQGLDLRYLPRGAGHPVTVAGGLQSPGTYTNNYYGYIAWPRTSPGTPRPAPAIAAGPAGYGPMTTVGSTRTSVFRELAT